MGLKFNSDTFLWVLDFKEKSQKKYLDFWKVGAKMPLNWLMKPLVSGATPESEKPQWSKTAVSLASDLGLE